MRKSQVKSICGLRATITWFIMVFVGLQALGAEPLYSAKRLVGQDWRESRAQFLSKLSEIRPLAWNNSAENAARSYDHLDRTRVHEWSSVDSVIAAFNYVRDEKFLMDPVQVPPFYRRLTWLYPDDGCYARAGTMKNLIDQKNLGETSRVFIFGNLMVKTDNSPRGEVGWWYHTAPAIRVGNDVYVLDPAINPVSPTLLDDWVKAQTDQINSVKLSFCSSETYHPGSDCDAPSPDGGRRAEQDQVGFLRWEWQRQVELGRDPVNVLGDTPPWL